MDSLSRSSNDSKETPVIQKVAPRTIPGILSSNNKGAFTWGWNSLIAYGCNHHVIVVETANLKVFQTLKKHKADVVKVKFARTNFYHDTFNPYSLILASADSVGKIIIWDIKMASVKKIMSEGSRPISEMEWVSHGSDSCHHLLAALHPPSTLVLWNTETGQAAWKKTFTGEILKSFAFDPFNKHNLALLASDCILFLEDFHLSKAPKGIGRKFYISSNAAAKVGTPSGEEKFKVSSLLSRRIRFMTKAETKNSEELLELNDCLQMAYHQSLRHHLLLLYPREVLILDLEINQTVGIVGSGLPMQMLYSTWQRDAMFCLQENGSVFFRLRAKANEVSIDGKGDNFSQDSPCQDITYETTSQSDSFRMTKNSRVMGMAVCPLTETHLALLISDGKIILLDLLSTTDQEILDTNDDGNFLNHSLSDILPSYYYNNQDKLPRFKLLHSGVLNALAPSPHIIQMCPPVTYRNWKYHQPFLAVGTTQGNIQILNMATGVMEKELGVHTSPVRGIEWAGLTSFISFAHPNLASSQGKVRNELALSDVTSGQVRAFRHDRNEESSPIQLVRVSHLKQYFIIVFKEEPFELWDLCNLVLLRTVPKTFPAITALTWFPIHLSKPLKQDSLDCLEKGSTSAPGISDIEGLSTKPRVLKKEHFVVTDIEGQLYHFIIEGNTIKSGSFIPQEAGLGSITSLVWKNKLMVMGDADGNLNIWDLDDRVSRGVCTRRGWIKKIKFAPGKGNMRILVLYNDGVDLWDIKEGERITSIKCPADLPKVQDIDWASSDRPVFSTLDGCIIISDFSLKACSSPVSDYQTSEHWFCPSLLSIKGAFHLKSFLQYQPWTKETTLSLIPKRGMSREDSKILEQITPTIDPDVVNYLNHCPWGTAERALLISRLFGDEEGCHFWMLALHYLIQAKKELKDDSKIPTICASHADLPLDSSYDFLCDTAIYKKLQLERAFIHDTKRASPIQTHKCAERLLLLGQSERAVQLLLETEPSSETYYVDSLKACLVTTASESAGRAHSVVKLVSTHLIAGGRVWEGVQLLSLIHKGADACRYLQSANLWDSALWLAKATLEDSEILEVTKRYVDFLMSPHVNDKDYALLLLLSMCQFWKVIELLHNAKMVERAALLVVACIEMGVLSKTDDNIALIEAIYLNYARYLLSVNNCHGALFFCDLVVNESSAASDLKREILILLEEHYEDS